MGGRFSRTDILVWRKEIEDSRRKEKRESITQMLTMRPMSSVRESFEESLMVSLSERRNRMLVLVLGASEETRDSDCSY